MRLIQLQENLDGIDASDFDALWRKISIECSDIIEDYRDTQKFLYRGVPIQKMAFFGASGNNRPPQASDKNASTIFDNFLKSVGCVARRSNSIFCTSDSAWAGEFGRLYILFPKNGFNYTFTNQKDMVISWYDIVVPETYTKLREESKTYLGTQNSLFAIIDKIDSPEELYDYIKKQLPKSEYVKSITPNDLINDQNLNDRYDVYTDNIDYAIRSKFEVMIKGEYYALTSDYQTLIHNRIGR